MSTYFETTMIVKPYPSQYLVNFHSIPEGVRAFCVDGGLTLVHYITTPPSKECFNFRGVVYKGEKVLVKSCPCTPEYVVGVDNVSNILKTKNMDGAVVTLGVEGTIVRIYFDDGEWRFSTFKNLNAKNSKWCERSPSFGAMFYDCWKSWDFETLDKSLCYTFLISHPAGRLVCNIKTPVLYLICVWNSDLGVFVDVDVNHSNVKKPEEVKCTSEQLIEVVNSVNPLTHSGVVVKLADGSMFKVLNREYYNNRLIRGNEPNLRIVYFENKKNKTLDKLYELLPEHMEFFNKIEPDLRKTIENIKKQHNDHTEYKETLNFIIKVNKICKWKGTAFDYQVEACIRTEPPHVLNALVSNYIKQVKKVAYLAKKVNVV